MALTAKPISTITYNTEEFLKRKLEQLILSHRIDDYRYIKHLGEDGDKNHIHLLLYPNKRIDTGMLKDEFNEIDNTNDKPLGCLPFRTSKTDHWLMYVLHDEQYLKSHKSDNDGDGKILYEVTDIVTPYPEQLERDFRKAIQLRQTSNQEVINRLMQGQSVIQIISETSLPPSMIGTIAQAFRNQYLYELQRQSYVENMDTLRHLAEITGQTSINIEEELPQLKAEERLGVSTKRQTTYQVDEQTGEIKTVNYEFKDKIEE